MKWSDEGEDLIKIKCCNLSLLVLTGLEELAQFPNVYCKVSGMFATDPNWDQKSVETVAKPCLELFGMDRYLSYFRVPALYLYFCICILWGILRAYIGNHIFVCNVLGAYICDHCAGSELPVLVC